MPGTRGSVEAGLLLQDVGRGGFGDFALQRQMHAHGHPE